MNFLPTKVKSPLELRPSCESLLIQTRPSDVGEMDPLQISHKSSDRCICCQFVKEGTAVDSLSPGYCGDNTQQASNPSARSGSQFMTPGLTHHARSCGYGRLKEWVRSVRSIFMTLWTVTGGERIVKRR